MRRTASLLALLALALPALAACGDAEEPTDEVTGTAGIEVAGEVGKAPEVAWDGRMTVDELETTVLTEGSGAEIESGDRVLAHLWIGNGYSNEVALDTHASKAEILTVGDGLVPGILAGVEGQKLGSRVMVAAPPEDAFGADGNPTLGIGNADSVLFVVDPVSLVPDKPEGATTRMPAGLPKLVEKDGVITGWDFTRADPPDAKLRAVTLIEGTGEPVRKGSTIATRYLGQVFKAKKPFDESYSAADPTTFTVGTGGLIKAWDQELVGVPAGSRVVLVVPPRLGYGKQGNESAGIKGTDTLYFVLDILATT